MLWMRGWQLSVSQECCLCCDRRGWVGEDPIFLCTWCRAYLLPYILAIHARFAYECTCLPLIWHILWKWTSHCCRALWNIHIHSPSVPLLMQCMLLTESDSIVAPWTLVLAECLSVFICCLMSCMNDLGDLPSVWPQDSSAFILSLY